MEYVTQSPISPGELFDKLQKNNSGSVLLHYAVVRRETEGRVTTSIHFERNGDIESELARITREIKEQWDVEDVLLIRRLGVLSPGEVISLVAVSAARSKDAFPACEYGMQRIRKLGSIKKTEVCSK